MESILHSSLQMEHVICKCTEKAMVTRGVSSTGCWKTDITDVSLFTLFWSVSPLTVLWGCVFSTRIDCTLMLRNGMMLGKTTRATCKCLPKRGKCTEWAGRANSKNITGVFTAELQKRNVPLIVRCLLSLLLQINPNINIYNSSPGLMSFGLSQIVSYFCSLWYL